MTRIGRNDPCPCGSGKKYKQCCAQRESAQLPASSIPDAIRAALQHHQAGRYPQAEAIYHQILRTSPNHPDALHFLGLIARQVGKLDMAVDLISKALSIAPNLAAAHYNLGDIFQVQGHLDKAIASYKNALIYEPTFADAYNNLGLAFKAQGLLDEAISNYRTALKLRPNFAEALSNLGNTFKAQGLLDEAISNYRAALELRPDFAEVYNNLGLLLSDKGLLDEAISNYRAALELRPDFAEAYTNLGNTLKIQQKLDEAITTYRQAILCKPDYAVGYYNLANTLQDIGSFSEAITNYHHALRLKPDHAEAHFNLGFTLKNQDMLDEAIFSYQKALTLKPDYAEAHNNLGNALKDHGQINEAIASYRQAIKLKPNYTIAHNNLGGGLSSQGNLKEAITCYRRTLELDPCYAEAHSNLIFTLDMMVDADTASLQAERKRWGGTHAEALHSSLSCHNSPDPERRLRVGYVSADLWDHSAIKVFGAMLAEFDATQFEVFAYSNFAKEDTHTQKLQQHITGWRKIFGLSDDAVADMIRQDGIDILVDLSGHSGGNRLLVFARKPAPIQITAWGYIGGTGMKAMDVFFADPVTVPQEEKILYTEEVRYLPNIVGSFFPETFPDVDVLPALSTHKITFGSFNRLAKVSDQAYKTWAQVLLAIPGSTMLLKSADLDDAGTRERVIERFSQEGVAPERITLRGRSSWEDHMAAFNQVDVALDPFPHGGGVTTLEGIMMGVPLVTLRWPTLVGRLSASILTTLGLTDWIAETPEQYVELAIQKSQNLTALATLRGELRNKFKTSIIGDQEAYVRAVEQEYRQLWREWCERQGVHE